MPRYGGYLVVMMLASPAMLVANALSDRHGNRRTHATKMKEYDAALASFESDRGRPRLATMNGTAARPGPGRPRWSAGPRRWTPGCGSAAGTIRTFSAFASAWWTARRMSPSAVAHWISPIRHRPRFATSRCASIWWRQASWAWPDRRGHLLAAARAWLIELATMHTPGDVAIVAITGADTACDWGWASWLPHTRPWSSAPRVPPALRDRRSSGGGEAGGAVAVDRGADRPTARPAGRRTASGAGGRRRARRRPAVAQRPRVGAVARNRPGGRRLRGVPRQ